MSDLAQRIRVEKGKRYWVNFAGKIQSAKILSVMDQNGYKMVRFRIGWPIFGEYAVESLAQFWLRMVKL